MKKILFTTGTRADYGKLKSIIIKLQKEKKFHVGVFVTGMHNMTLFGATFEEIKKDKRKKHVKALTQTKHFLHLLFANRKKENELRNLARNFFI